MTSTSTGTLITLKDGHLVFSTVGTSSDDDTNNNSTPCEQTIAIDDHQSLKKKCEDLVETMVFCVGGEPVRQHLVPAHFQLTGAPALTSYYDLSCLPAINEENALELVSKSSPEELQSCLQQITYGIKNEICNREEAIEEDVVVRTRGLPWQATDMDMANFFIGLEIAPGGIALCLSSEGRRNGEALVRFTSPEMRAMALKRHRQFLLSRYIEVYKASSEEFLQISAGSSREAMAFVSTGNAVTIRMRGLPYDCSENQIKEFFMREPGSCKVCDKMLFVARSDGRPTGDAFVQFETEEEGQAALAKNRQTIGNRYIELFRSTAAEVQQVVKRSGEPSTGQSHRKECIRLRGLPYEAQVQNVVEFLGEHARNIQYQGVHMVFNTQGHPSGEAFIQMNSEQSAAAAAAAVHNKFMNIGKKQRYIEVFQCSTDDMNLVGPTNAGPPPPAVPPMILPPVQRPPFVPGVLPMWAYPSPPVSPNFLLSSQINQLIVYGIAPNVGVADLVAQFTSPETVVENVMFTRFPTAGLAGEAVVSLRPRLQSDIDPQMYQKMTSESGGPMPYPSRLYTVIQS